MPYSHTEITEIIKFLKLSSIVHRKLFDATSVFLAKAVHLIAFFLSFPSPVLGTTSEVIFTISNYILKEEKKDLRSESIAIMRKKPRYKVFFEYLLKWRTAALQQILLYIQAGGGQS